MDQSWLDIDLDAIAVNVARFRALGGGRVPVIAVVKADGYGHGAVKVSKAALAAGASRLAVANVREALELRSAGLAAPIHILGSLLPAEVETVVEHGLIAPVNGPELLPLLSRAAVRQETSLQTSSTDLPLASERDGGADQRQAILDLAGG